MPSPRRPWARFFLVAAAASHLPLLLYGSKEVSTALSTDSLGFTRHAATDHDHRYHHHDLRTNWTTSTTGRNASSTLGRTGRRVQEADPQLLCPGQVPDAYRSCGAAGRRGESSLCAPPPGHCQRPCGVYHLYMVRKSPTRLTHLPPTQRHEREPLPPFTTAPVRRFCSWQKFAGLSDPSGRYLMGRRLQFGQSQGQVSTRTSRD